MKLFEKYKSDQSGNVGVMFSLSLVAVVTLAGVAVDYGQMTKQQSVLQSQVDAAVLAAISVGLEDQDVSFAEEQAFRKGVALEVMSGNGFDMTGVEPTFIITDDNSVFARAELNYRPAFGAFLGKDTVNLVAESESGLGTGNDVHIALVLDNTLSMLPNGKMTALKTGALNLTRTIEELGGESKIALVPFARYVRIPEANYSSPWLEVPEEFDTEITWQQATHTGGTCTLETQTRIRDGLEEVYQTNVCVDQITTYETMSRVIESRFEGCVGTRPPPFSERDGTYAQRVPGLLHLIPEQVSGTYESNAWCASAITPLTDDYDTVIAGINELYGTDQTYLPSGLLWGQAVLSPGEPFDNADADDTVQKIMILMTDGQNSSQIQLGHDAEAAYKAPPYIATSDLVGQYSPDANQVTARMCNNIKAEGIQIYTIAFQVNDTETKNLLEACASHDSMAYTAESNDALIARFDHISGTLEGNARLMR